MSEAERLTVTTDEETELDLEAWRCRGPVGGSEGREGWDKELYMLMVLA